MQAYNDRREWNLQGRQDLLLRWNKLTPFLPPSQAAKLKWPLVPL